MTLSDFFVTVATLSATMVALIVLDFLLGRDTIVKQGAELREVTPLPRDLPPI